MQTVPLGGNLREMANLFSRKDKKNTSKCHLLKFFSSMQTVLLVTILVLKFEQEHVITMYL